MNTSFHNHACHPAAPGIKKSLLAALLGMLTLTVHAQSSLRYDVRTRTAFSVPLGTDISLLTQHDLSTMLPFEEIQTRTIAVSPDGNLTDETEIIYVAGNRTKEQEIGYRSVTSENGITTYLPDGTILIQTPFDETAAGWIQEKGLEYKDNPSMLTPDPFSGLDTWVSSLPSELVETQGTSITIKSDSDASSTTYLPEQMTVLTEQPSDNGLTSTVREVYRRFADGSIVLNSRTVRTPRQTYAGVTIIEETRSEYSNYEIVREKNAEPREGTITFGTENLELFPNPVHDFLLVRGIESDQPIEIQLYSVWGSLVGTWKRSGDKEQIMIPVSQLHPGTYLLSVRTSNGGHHSATFVKI